MRLKKFLVIVFAILLCSRSNAQSFVVYSENNQEPLELVTAVKISHGNVLESIRSDFKGEINFLNPKVAFDSVVFFKMGYKTYVMTIKKFNKNVYLQSLNDKLEEVVITGQIIPGNKYQSPFRIKYYTESEIKSKSSLNLADFLQTENNFNVSQDPILGTTVSINGMSGSDLKLMIDNVPVSGRVNGNIDYSQILLSNIERIEIVNGPLSTIYGTNATGGVINLITKTGSINESNITGSLYGESVGIFNGNVNFNTTRNKHKVSLGIQRYLFGGWDQYADSLSIAVKPIWREKAWRPKEQFAVNASYVAPISSKTSLQIRVNSFWESIINKYNPTSPYQNIVYDDDFNTNRVNIGSNSSTILSKVIEWQNYLNLNLYNRDVISYSQDLREGTRTKLNTNSENITNIFFRSQFRQDFNKKIKFLYGTDFNIDNGNSIKLNQNVKAVWDFGLFCMANVKFNEKFLMQPGLRFGANNITQNPVSGTVNFRYQLLNFMSLQFSMSRGYRIPDIKELYFDFVDINHNIHGNPNLKSELNDNIQGGIDIIPTHKSKSITSYSSSLYFTYYNKQNAIELVNINPTFNEFQYFNIGNSIGTIYSIDNRIKTDKFMFSLGASINGYSKTFNKSINQISNFLYNYTINCNATYKFNKTNTKLTLLNKFYSSYNFLVFNIINNSVSESKMPAYYLLDFNIAQPLFNEKLYLTLGLKNILDYKNLLVTGNTGAVHSNNDGNSVNNLWGRTVFLRVDFNLNIKKQ